jgi:hypothetical protein
MKVCQDIMSQNTEDRVRLEQIRSQVLKLAQEGFIIGMCPHCDIPLSYEEIISDKCDQCKEIFTIDMIPWYPISDMPDA